jgi:hypothetical protein
MKFLYLIEQELKKPPKNSELYNTTRKYPDQLKAEPIKGAKKDWSPANEEPHLSDWLTLPNGIKYVVVDGPFVRDNFHIDYVEGGHFYRYAFIPEDTIWIEDEMEQLDRIAVGLHETHERFLMKERGWRYDPAHESASNIERKFRDLIKEKGTYIPPYDEVAKMYYDESRGHSRLRIALGKETGENTKIKIFSFHNSFEKETGGSDDDEGNPRSGDVS